MIHRASSVGACLKGQIAAALGYKPIEHTEQQLLTMAQGQLHEDDVIANLLLEGCIISEQQQEVNLYVGGGQVQGHLDGLIVDDYPRGRVLEIKSMGKSSFAAFKAKGWEAGGLIDRYKWQLSTYQHATNLEALLIAKCRDNGELLRHGVEMPFYSLNEIAERVAYIEDHVARGELPTDCPRDFFCNYKYLCERPEAEPESDATFTPGELARVDAYYTLGQRIAGMEAERKHLREGVEALAGRTGSGYRVQLITQNIKERIVPASTRQSLRVTKMEDDGAPQSTE